MATEEASNIEHVSIANRIAYLSLKSQSIFAKLDSISTNITSDKLCAMDEYELKGLLDSLSKLQSNFENAHNGLEELDFDAIGSDLPCKFDSTLSSVKLMLQREIGRRSVSQHCSTFRLSGNENPSMVVVPNRSRLPQLNLPTFSGGYTEWTDFHSMFTTVVDSDADLTAIEKLQHLRSCLSGAALDTIRSLEIKDTNYKAAMDLLIKRFDNSRLIFQAHVNEIFGLSKVDASVAKLRGLTDKLVSHMRALQSLGSKEQIADCIIVQLLLQKLDKSTQLKWEEQSPLNEVPTWDRLSEFLERRCRTLENVEHAMETHGHVSKPFKTVSTNKKASFVASSYASGGCIFCNNAGHSIYYCTRFANLSPHLRQKEAKKLGLCLNCLKKGHHLRDCKSGQCRNCQAKHHTLLHFDSSSSASAVSSSLTQASPSQLPVAESISIQPSAMIAMSSASTDAFAPQIKSDVVLLATAVILVKNRAGTLVPCRALLDSGSQLHFITTRFANQLQLPKSKSLAAVSGIGDSNFETEGYAVSISLKSCISDYTASITSVIAQTITDNQPNCAFKINDWNIPANIKLADPHFNTPQRIDMLIGAGLFFELLCVGRIQLAPGLPTLQKTRFGWILSGGGHQPHQLSSLVVNLKSSEASNSSTRLEEIVRSFWETENSFEPIAKSSKEALDCEEHFKQHFSRLPSGEYSVRLPMKLGLDSLGDSYHQAERRFYNLERKLSRNPVMKQQYSAFIEEYITLNHMSLVADEDKVKCKYFLPHHCVMKHDSTTTKLRVVFDGSATTTTGHSLNDVLMAGPTIQPTLFNILIRFRTFRIALTGDICKMYRCVRMAPPDNMLQCILWRNTADERLKIYKLDTVTYGTKPASFLAIRAMHQLALDETTVYPLGSQIVLRDFYVDDMISGGNSVQEVQEIKQQTTNLLERGHFKLRKWCSNNPAVLRGTPDADKESLLKFDDGSDITKALGLIWDPAEDNFLFSFMPRLVTEKNNKRNVLSTIARFYDPLGLIGPTLTRAKILLQRMWREKLTWDESLPISLESTWSALYNDFVNVHHSKFPRYVLQHGTAIQLHAFCDASIEAYGACIYVLSERNDNLQAHLLCSKARVAPLKSITVPKLELCAAALLAQLVSSISKMNIFNCQFHCWSDSSVVLSWLREEPSKFNVFVANRVSAIQQLTNRMQWHYVPTALNPADILSKGATPSELLQSNLWMHGPPFLQESQSNWPESCLPERKLPEIRQRALVTLSNPVDITLSFKYINSFGMMQRIFGYVHKFITAKTSSKQLSADNIHHGTHILIRIVQIAQMQAEYKALQLNKCIHSSSNLISLSPFMDKSGLIRVGGRLKNSMLSFNARHPIILPRAHPLTFAIIMHLHRKYHHAGTQSLLSSIRLQYWPIGGRKTVARALRKCMICCRAKPRLVEHIMADLPSSRIHPSRPFTITGVDYCGPFYYKNDVRNRPPQKCYISIFICFTTKAVWMELVKDLTTAAFIDALKRFVATRGKPRCMWSDNATNFVGAKNQLDELRRLFLSENHQNEVHAYCIDDGFDWRFIPPRSPHFGGLWEASVKLAKHHLYRSLGSSTLHFDGLRTLVCQITAIINSRPLIPLSENPDDLDVLTPAHFLIGGPFTSTAEPDVTSLNYNRLDRWQRVTFAQQIFWKRWSEEYLTHLQQRSKWRASKLEIQVNDVVCIKDENLAPLKWPIARVIELVRGKDGVARVAILRTSTGTTRRAVNKLCVLPAQESVENPVFSTGGGCSEMQPQQQQ